MSIIHPGVQLDTMQGGRQQNKVLLFGHRRGLVAFHATGLHSKSFQDRAEINKA